MADFTPPPEYAEYPREQFQPMGEFDRPPGVYFDALSDAWTLVKRDTGMWMALTIVAFLLIMLLQLPFQIVGAVVQGSSAFDPKNPFDFGRTGVSSLIGFIGGVFTYPVYAGMYWAALKQIRGYRVDIADLFIGFKHFLPLIGFGVIYNLLVIAGLALCIIPGVFVYGLLTPGMLLILDRKMGPLQAVSESLRVIGSQAWLLGLFLIVAGLGMGALGFLLCCIGLLVTTPIFIVATALHYHYFFPPVRSSEFDQAPV